MKTLHIDPPLLNTPCPWAKTLEQLRELYHCKSTGAVTTRTSMIDGFPDDPKVNQFVFFNPSSHSPSIPNHSESTPDKTATLNTIGFSPFTLDEYLSFIKTISDELPADFPLKPFIVSVTGPHEEMGKAYEKITAFQSKVKMDLAMEINLSCPNIPGKVSPAYDKNELLIYLNQLNQTIAQLKQSNQYLELPIGIKMPPFTYQEQYDVVIDALLSISEQELPIQFIVSTNTLGSSLLLQNQDLPNAVLKSMAGTGIGGMAGAAIHPLALGNVYTLRKMLDQHPALQSLQLIGVGGVSDVDGYRRMKSVGAYAVGIASAIGAKGVAVFEEIHQQVKA